MPNGATKHLRGCLISLLVSIGVTKCFLDIFDLSTEHPKADNQDQDI